MKMSLFEALRYERLSSLVCWLSRRKGLVVAESLTFRVHKLLFELATGPE